MTEFTYNISVKDRIDFETRFYSEFSAKWAPARGYTLIGVVFFLVAAALIFTAIPQPERAVLVLAAALGLFRGFLWAIQLVTKTYYRRYLERQLLILRLQVLLE